MFSEPFRILAMQRTYCEVQDDIHGIEKCVTQNKMKLAIDKYAYLTIRGRHQKYKLMGKHLVKTATVKDLGTPLMCLGNSTLKKE